MDDKTCQIPGVDFKLDLVIGYPVLAALGNVTFLQDGDLEFDSPHTHQGDPGARMFLDGLTPVVGITDGNTIRLCVFDSGAPVTTLYDTYEQAHAMDYAQQSTVNIPYTGLGGTHTIPAYIPDHTTLIFGSTPVNLGRLPVLTEPHTADLTPELFYGNIGQDVIRNSAGVELDFRVMRFYVTPQSNDLQHTAALPIAAQTGPK
jgi:hypothetical protein